MQDQQPTRPHPPARQSRFRSLPLGVIAGLAAVGLVAGGGTAWFTWRSLTAQSTSPTPAQAPQTAQSSQPQPSQAPAKHRIQIYWLKSVGSKIELAPSTVALNANAQPSETLKAAFEKMLQGTTDPSLTSTIPKGTTLQTVAVKSDGVHVDLSTEFTSGGGSTSMTGRIAQVVYTATTLNPSAPVWISVEGKPLEVLGSEGLLIDQPMTRKSFEQNFTL
jgi:spore germination protein GerM